MKSEKFTSSVFQTTEIYAKDVFDPYHRGKDLGEPDIEIRLSCVHKNQDNELLKERIALLTDKILKRICEEYGN